MTEPKSGGIEMPRDKASEKQAGPTTRYGRQIVYDREIFIEICQRLLLGQRLQEICAEPPMPPPQVYLMWIQDHREAREIDRAMMHFRYDRARAKELNVFMVFSTREWAEQVRDNCNYGWPADRIDRGYIPPDWSKVYPTVGAPPVLSMEDRPAYDDLINACTERLKPRDEIELSWTKRAADARWEADRIGRKKTALLQQKCRERQHLLGQLGRQSAPTAPDYSLGVEASPEYRALDIAQSRAMKRHDDALREIAQYRRRLGATPRELPHKFVDERILARRYGVDDQLEQPLPKDENDTTAGAAVETDSAPAPAVEAAQPASPPCAASDKAADAPPSHAPSEQVTQAEPSRAHAAAQAAPSRLAVEETAQSVQSLTPSDANAEAPAAVTSSDAPAEAQLELNPALEAAQAAPPVATADAAAEAQPALTAALEAAQAAPPVATADAAAEAQPALTPALEAAQAAPPVATADAAAEAQPAPTPALEAAQAAPPTATSGEPAEAAPALAHSAGAAQAAHALAASDERGIRLPSSSAISCNSAAPDTGEALPREALPVLGECAANAAKEAHPAAGRQHPQVAS
jgi:hypothetical protein